MLVCFSLFIFFLVLVRRSLSQVPAYAASLLYVYLSFPRLCRTWLFVVTAIVLAKSASSSLLICASSLYRCCCSSIGLYFFNLFCALLTMYHPSFMCTFLFSLFLYASKFQTTGLTLSFSISFAETATAEFNLLNVVPISSLHSHGQKRLSLISLSCVSSYFYVGMIFISILVLPPTLSVYVLLTSVLSLILWNSLLFLILLKLVTLIFSL